MKINFGKNKEIEVSTPEKTLEEQLNEAKEEIVFLEEQLKTPLKESRKKFRERQEVLEKNLRKDIDEYYSSVETADKELIKQIEETESLKSEYDKLLNELKIDRENFDKEKDDYFEKLDSEFKDKNDKFERQKKRDIKKIDTMKNQILSEAEKEAMGLISNGINDINTRKEELETKYKAKMEELDLKREQIEKECQEVLQKIEDDSKKLDILEKKIKEKSEINKVLNKKLFKKIGIICVVTLILLSMFLWLFRNSIFPFTTISSSISSMIDNDFTEINGDIVFAVNGEAITRMSIFDGINKFRGEEYFTLTMKDDSNVFTWERYNKGDAEFIKVPYESQYVLAKNRNEAGWHFNKDESQKLMKDVYYSLISRAKVTNKNIISEYKGSNVFSNMWIFIKNRFVANQLSYNFNIDSNAIKSVYGVIKSSPGYKSFVDENDYIRDCLKLGGNDAVDDFLIDGLISSNITEATGEVQVKDGKITNIGINFHGTNNNQDKISIYCTFSFTRIDKNKSYEKQIFMMNSMPYNEVYPRVKQNDFENLESQGNIQENISTLKDLEDKGYDFTG